MHAHTPPYVCIYTDNIVYVYLMYIENSCSGRESSSQFSSDKKADGGQGIVPSPLSFYLVNEKQTELEWGGGSRVGLRGGVGGLAG